MCILLMYAYLRNCVYISRLDSLIVGMNLIGLLNNAQSYTCIYIYIHVYTYIYVYMHVYTYGVGINLKLDGYH